MKVSRQYKAVYSAKKYISKHIALFKSTFFYFINKKITSISERGDFCSLIWMPDLKSWYWMVFSTYHCVYTSSHIIRRCFHSLLIVSFTTKNLFAFRVILRSTFEVKKMVSKLQTGASIFCILGEMFVILN